MITFENPPAEDDPFTPSRDDVAKELIANRRRWAVVARHDRAARAATHVDRIADGREYGEPFEAVARRVGNEHRVYARYVGR